MEQLGRLLSDGILDRTFWCGKGPFFLIVKDGFGTDRFLSRDKPSLSPKEPVLSSPLWVSEMG